MITHTLDFTHPTFWAEYEMQQPILGADDLEVERNEKRCAEAIGLDWKYKRKIVGLWFGDLPTGEAHSE